MALDVELGAGVNLVFSTPVLIRTMSDAEPVNAALRAAILKAEATDSSVQVSNVGGWQSDTSFLQWPIPEIATLRTWIDDAVVHMSRLPFSEPAPVEYSAYGWANVNRNGDYNRVHNHGEDHWACVYYVDSGQLAPGRAMNGKIEFRDPRQGASTHSDNKFPGFTFGHAMLVTPQTGTLLVFPGWLDHCVHPFFGEGERISIAINIRLIKVGSIVPT
jgi:uncharacterized protein (TIGR02466 family)